MDLTSPGTLDVLSNLVYVPGIAKDMLPADFKDNTPRLYTDLQTFQADFGSKIPRIGLGSKNASDYPGFGDGFGYDTGFIYATELLRAGIPVLYDCLAKKAAEIKDDNGIVIGYNADADSYNLEEIERRLSAGLQKSSVIITTSKYDLLTDKGLYNIKYICSGGYVSKEINTAMFELVKARQDCVALVDIPYNKSVLDVLVSEQEGINVTDIVTLDTINDKYAALFGPWAIYETPIMQSQVKSEVTKPILYYPNTYELPGSFGYLMAMAIAIKNGSNNWLAMAGANRGRIPYIVALKEEITTAIIDIMQTRTGRAMNPVAVINPFGTIVWGNRTLNDNSIKGDLTASSFLNIRNLCSDVKKTVWTSARNVTFEQNSDILWVNFKSLITPTLDQMVTGGGLAGYELIKKVSKKKATLNATIRLYAIEAVEDFEIDIELADQSAAIVE